MTNDPIPYVVVGSGDPSSAPQGAIPIDLYGESSEGPPGPTGPGVAPEGSTGEFLVKASNSSYDTEWKKLTWGAFYSTVTQDLPVANQAYPVNFGLTAYADGISVSDSFITVSQQGTYNLQFSLQVTSATQQLRTAYIWLRENAVNVPHSTGKISISETNSIQIATWNYFLQADAGDFYELMIQVNGTGVSLGAEGASGNYPETTSAILTMHQVN